MQLLVGPSYIHNATPYLIKEAFCPWNKILFSRKCLGCLIAALLSKMKRITQPVSSFRCKKCRDVGFEYDSWERQILTRTTLCSLAAHFVMLCIKTNVRRVFSQWHIWIGAMNILLFLLFFPKLERLCRLIGEWIRNFIPHFTVHVITYPLKLIHVSKWGSQ